MNLRLLTTGWLLMVLLLSNRCYGSHTWDYELLALETTSSDDNKLDFKLRTERLGPNVYGGSGTAMFNYNLDDSTMVEAVAHRSSSGNEDDYNTELWRMPKQSYEEFIGSLYKNTLYKILEGCSNLPHPDNAWPWPLGTYNIDKCVATGDGLPEIVPEGYYKLKFSVTGEVDWGFTIIVKVTRKSLLG